MELKFDEKDLEALADLLADKITERMQIHTPPKDKLLTVDELAEYLGVAKSWVYERTRDRSNSGIPKIRVGKYRKFHLPDVLSWLKDKYDQ